MGTPGFVYLQKRLDFFVCFVILCSVVVDVGTIGLMQYSFGVLIGTPHLMLMQAPNRFEQMALVIPNQVWNAANSKTRVQSVKPL